MARPLPHTNVGPPALRLWFVLERQLLLVGHSLQEGGQGEDYPADVVASVERAADSLGVDNGDGQRNGPGPYSLQQPKGSQSSKIIALVVEATILAPQQDAVEQEGAQAGAPGEDAGGEHDLARVEGGADRKRENGQ
ncbi:isoprenylcysteine carboxyl methyltransferase [Gracilaria domingensis]|nr:isoprenylcysteine carboxyl methyltransferase [Gracilaria domingensis]